MDAFQYQVRWKACVILQHFAIKFSWRLWSVRFITHKVSAHYCISYSSFHIFLKLLRCILPLEKKKGAASWLMKKIIKLRECILWSVHDAVHFYFMTKYEHLLLVLSLLFHRKFCSTPVLIATTTRSFTVPSDQLTNQQTHSTEGVLKPPQRTHPRALRCSRSLLAPRGTFKELEEPPWWWRDRHRCNTLG